MAAPQSQCDTSLVCLSCCPLSRGEDAARGEEKCRVGEWNSRGWNEQYPTEWGNCFSPGWFPGRGLFFFRKMAGVMSGDDPAQVSPSSHYSISLPNAFHSRLSSGDSSSHHPPFNEPQREWLWMKNLCFGPLIKQKQKCGFVSRGPHLSLVDGNLNTFYRWILCRWLIPALACCASEPSLGSRLHSSQGEAAIATLSLCDLGLLPVGADSPLLWPHPSYASRGGFCPSFLVNSLLNNRIII